MLRSNSKSLGNPFHIVSPEEEKRKAAVGRICRKEGFKSVMEHRVGDGKLIIRSITVSGIRQNFNFRRNSSTIRSLFQFQQIFIAFSVCFLIASLYFFICMFYCLFYLIVPLLYPLLLTVFARTYCYVFSTKTQYEKLF